MSLGEGGRGKCWESLLSSPLYYTFDRLTVLYLCNIRFRLNFESSSRSSSDIRKVSAPNLPQSFQIKFFGTNDSIFHWGNVSDPDPVLSKKVRIGVDPEITPVPNIKSHNYFLTFFQVDESLQHPGGEAQGH